MREKDSTDDPTFSQEMFVDNKDLASAIDETDRLELREPEELKDIQDCKALLGKTLAAIKVPFKQKSGHSSQRVSSSSSGSTSGSRSETSSSESSDAEE